MKEERAIFAGGCFWGMQDLIRRLAGVISTRVRYTGGDVPNATYRNHGTHAEAIEIIFDPSKISYRRQLEFFFQIHDPTTKNRQGNEEVELFSHLGEGSDEGSPTSIRYSAGKRLNKPCRLVSGAGKVDESHSVG